MMDYLLLWALSAGKNFKSLLQRMSELRFKEGRNLKMR
jgi:hypothetical protein